MTSLCSTRGDLKQLMEAREAARQEGPPTRAERVKFICRVVGEPESVAQLMELVLKAHLELDRQCRAQAEAACFQVDNLTVADVAYPLITKRVMGVFQQQLVHVRNGCISDDPNRLPYARVGTVNYHFTGHHLPHYQSLRRTSKVEAVHSVLDPHSVGLGQKCLTHGWDGGSWDTTATAFVPLARRFLQTPCLLRYTSKHFYT